jgi:uncharacterized protein HemX
MDFLDHSVRDRDHEIRLMETRRKMGIRRSRTFSVALSLLLVLAIGMSVYALKLRNVAIAQRQAVEAQKDVALQALAEAEKQRIRAEAAQRDLANLTAAQAEQLKRATTGKKSR